MGHFSRDEKDLWHWTLLIVQPDFLTEADFEAARAEARRKKGSPALDRVRLERFEEGLSAQVLHLGPYAAEAPTIERLHRSIAERGYRMAGKHHEIYLSDPRRAAPEKMKTILRQPVAPARGNEPA
jgi:hypothetical protein